VLGEGDESVKVKICGHSGNCGVCCVDFEARIGDYTAITLSMSNVAEFANVVLERNLRDLMQKLLEENTVVQRQ
jgi:hypothetical protein